MGSSIIFMYSIEYLVIKTSVNWAFLLSFVLLIVSCEPQEKQSQKDRLPKNDAALIGTWKEEDSLNNVVWIFDQHEVKWNGFTHSYHVSGDSLIISGLVFPLLEQSKERIKMVKLNGKPCILNRKD